MNCEACGHDWVDHRVTRYLTNPPDNNTQGLCEECYHEPRGGPCFPWEFR